MLLFGKVGFLTDAIQVKKKETHLDTQRRMFLRIVRLTLKQQIQTEIPITQLFI